jgi:hypothetical protein
MDHAQEVHGARVREYLFIIGAARGRIDLKGGMPERWRRKRANKNKFAHATQRRAQM